MTDDLADYLAITRLKHEWAHHYDRGDLDRLLGVFSPDAVLDQGPYGTWSGHEGIRAGYQDRFARRFTARARLHILSNPHIEVDGDEATGSWYLTDHAFDGSGARPLTLLGTYDDRYRRGDDGRWLISTSRFDIYWSELDS
ncbi:MAG: nuclear transport factor 2 family protein [Acidimicrobiia bacterium]